MLDLVVIGRYLDFNFVGYYENEFWIIDIIDVDLEKVVVRFYDFFVLGFVCVSVIMVGFYGFFFRSLNLF